MWPGLGCARRWASHFGGQPIHIPKVSQNSLEFDPPAFYRDEVPGWSHPPIQPSHTVMPSTRSLSCNCGEVGSPGPSVLGLKVGVGDRQRRATELGTSMSCLCRSLSSQLSSVTMRAPQLSHRTGERCSTAPSAFASLFPILFPP